MGLKQLSGGPMGIFVLLYAAVYLYATFTSVSLSGSLFPGLLTAAFVLFYFVTVSCGWNAVQLRRLAMGMAAVGILVSGYGFYQLLFPAQFRSVWTDTDMFSTITFRVYSTLENPNVLGEYFLLVIPFAAALLLTADSWKKRALWLPVCGVLAVCLVVTYSRGCYLGLLFAAAVFLVLLDRRFLILGIIAVVLSPLYLPESVLTRFTSIGNMADSSTSFRVYIWMGTLAMLKDYWFCGVGPGTEAFNLVYPNYAYSAIEAPHSHNLYLQILCDTGVVGLGLFLGLMVCFYRMMFTAIRREGDRTSRIFQIAGVSAVSGFLLQSMTDYTFYNYRVMFLFWAVLGLCTAFCRAGQEVRRD
jgi:putative inorganic carbon (HCO3(-)) transporter